MSTIAITGARGFIGKNLTVRLHEVGHVPVAIPHDVDEPALKALLVEADFVIHLAGVNRPETDAEFASGNVGVTQTLVAALTSQPQPLPVLYASSIQAALDNPYGNSKRQAEDILRAYGVATGAPVRIYRLPNVFGKWCRPNYNSAVATFCHNISRNIPITINKPDAPLQLVYIDNVVDAVIAWIAHGASGAPTEVQPVYRTTVGELAAQLQAFRDGRQSLVAGAVGTGLKRALHATYLSYLDPADFAYPLVAHTDARGSFAEVLRTEDSGQFSFFTAHPGITRGGHYHHSKTEKFLVVKGRARFGFRHILTDEIFTLETSDDRPQVVETVPGWSHDITNIGDDEMVVMLWANELFDSERPDTVAAKVLP